VNVEQVHEAVWAALQSISGAALSVYDGVVPATPAGNYAVLWMAPGRAVSTRIGWKATDLAATFQVTCVSRNSPRACAATVDLVRGKLTGLLLGDPLAPNAPRCKEAAYPAPPPPDQSVSGDIRWWMPLPYRVDTSI
jgi:hypothetical protein